MLSSWKLLDDKKKLLLGLFLNSYLEREASE